MESSRNHSKHEIPPPNEPGAFEAARWFINNVVDGPRAIEERIVTHGLLEDLESPQASFDNFLDSKEISRRVHPRAVIQRYWRDVGVISAASLGSSTQEADCELAWELAQKKAVQDLYKATAAVPLVLDLYQSRYMKPDEIAQLSARNGATLMHQAAKDAEDLAAYHTEEPKKIKKAVSARARYMSEYLVDYYLSSPDISSDLTDRNANPGYYENYLTTALAMYGMALTSGNKDVYQTVADRMEKIARIETGKHKVNARWFIPKCADAFNNDPAKIAGLLEDRLEKGSSMPGMLYVKHSLWTSLAQSLRALKPHAVNIQSVHLANISQAATNLPLLMDLSVPVEKDDEQSPENLDLPIKLEPTQLDWQILPPGELEQHAREIVDDAAKRQDKVIEIDLERLTMLDAIRNTWGTDRSYYARGYLGGGKQGNPLSAESVQANEYILLILQELNDNNQVTAEHAVAESPVAGPHAAYVYRQDISPERHSWRSIMSLTKKQARAHGARRVKHTLSGKLEAPLTEQITEKVQLLLDCSPEEFESARFFSNNTSFYLGKRAVEAA